MASGTLTINEDDFAVRSDDGWVEVQLSPRVMPSVVEALKDMIRSLSWRDETESLRLVSTLVRMAYSLSRDGVIRTMSLQDVATLLCVQSIRTSKMGEWLSYHLAKYPIREAPMSSDPVFADSVAKGMEALMSD